MHEYLLTDGLTSSLPRADIYIALNNSAAIALLAHGIPLNLALVDLRVPNQHGEPSTSAEGVRVLDACFAHQPCIPAMLMTEGFTADTASVQGAIARMEIAPAG